MPQLCAGAPHSASSNTYPLSSPHHSRPRHHFPLVANSPTRSALVELKRSRVDASSLATSAFRLLARSLVGVVVRKHLPVWPHRTSSSTTALPPASLPLLSQTRSRPAPRPLFPVCTHARRRLVLVSPRRPPAATGLSHANQLASQPAGASVCLSVCLQLTPLPALPTFVSYAWHGMVWYGARDKARRRNEMRSDEMGMKRSLTALLSRLAALRFSAWHCSALVELCRARSPSRSRCTVVRYGGRCGFWHVLAFCVFCLFRVVSASCSSSPPLTHCVLFGSLGFTLVFLLPFERYGG
ncbi:hypothetical protein IWZ03DRAFT_170405 [Phyllosticta citriasiana]|uniref:Uncharacterized protein n=1 Tax=Phyllosticta citriasiana TaxID=595635 RepID=A0ABR1KLI6_9PEZI